MLGRKYLYGTRKGNLCREESIYVGRETLLCSALGKHERKCFVVGWGRNSDARFGKEDGFGGCLVCNWAGKNFAFCLLGGAGVGFSAWPSLPSADSGRGAAEPRRMQVAEPEPSAARMQGSSWGVEMLETIPAPASKFCKWQQFLQQPKLLQPDCLVHLKSWLLLKMFIFENHP